MRLAKGRGEGCYPHAMWTTLWQHLSHRLLYAAGFSPFWPAGASGAPLGWEGSQALQIHSDWWTDQSSFCNDLQKCFWGSEDLVGLERPGCNLQSQAVDLEGLHGSCLRWLPPPALLPAELLLFAMHTKHCSSAPRRAAAEPLLCRRFWQCAVSPRFACVPEGKGI